MELLVVTLLRIALKLGLFVIDCVSCLYYSPALILLTLALDISYHYGYRRRLNSDYNNGVLLVYYLIFPVLYVITTLAVPSIVLYPIFAFYESYALYISEHYAGFWGMMISLTVTFLSMLAMSIRAFIVWEDNIGRSYRNSNVDIFSDWVEFQVRLPKHVFSIVMLVNPVRFLYFLKKGYKSSNLPQFTDLMVESTVKALLDYLCLPFCLLIAVTMWRIPHVWSQKKWSHKLFFRNGSYILLEIPAYALSIIFNIIGFYRIKGFIKGFKEQPVEGFDRANYCFAHCVEVLIDMPFIALGLCLSVTVYRFIPIIQQYRDEKRTKSMRIITFEQFICLVLDLPSLLAFIILFVTRYRWALTRSEQKKEAEKGNFLYFHATSLYMFSQMLLDFIHIVLCVPIFVTFWRAAHLYSAVFIDVFYDEKFFTNSDSDELEKVELVGNEIFIQRREIIRDIFKNWIIDIAFICLGLLSLWRIPRIVLHYITIITNEEKAGSMRNKAMEELIQSILDVLALIALITLVIPTLYRIASTIKRIRTEDTIYQFVVLSEAFAVLKDLPFILLGLLSMWRLPVIILKIWVFHKEEYETAEKRRQLALQQFLDAMLDIPFVISLVLMILSIMHIFTIFLLYRKYKKAKKEEKELGKQRELFTFFRGKILKQLYLLPLQIPLIICTYLVTFTVYRIPITVTTMKSLVGQKEPKKLAAKVIVSQALSIPFDLICTVMSAIIVITVYRIKDLVAVLKTYPIFKSTFAIREALEVHKQIALVFWNLVKDIPIIILLLVSSITVWRIKHILRALANETDYKKRLILLGTNALLTVLDIPCILCSGLLLISWRSKRVVNIVNAAYVSGRLSEAHYSILLEFYELILDIVHIALIPLLLWRIPAAMKSAWQEETAKGRRGIVRYHLNQIILDVPYMLLTLVVMLSVYRNVELYHFLYKKKSKKGYREFIRDQALQFVIDIPIVIISLCTCIVIPYRVYFMFKYLFLYEKWKNRDEERRRELGVLIAKTLVDLLTLVFGIALLVMFWRIPFVVYRYMVLKEGVRRTLWIEFKSAILDILCVAALFINLTFVYQFPYTVKRLYFFTTKCIKNLIAFMKTKPFSTKKSSSTKQTSEDNGAILPSDMFYEILTYLSPEETTSSFDRVCKYWHELSRQDSFLWQLYLDIDKKANLLDKKFQANYNNAHNYNYYSYGNTINLNEAYYNAIGTYKKEDFASVFKNAFSASDSENRNEYIKRYLDTKSRYSFKEYTFEDAVNDDYKAGFHHIMKAETEHVLSHIYKLFFIRYKLMGLVLYPFYYIISYFSHVEGIRSDMSWDRIEFLVLLLPINAFMLLVSLTEKMFYLLDIFPFFGYKWWGNDKIQLWDYRNFHGKKYATSIFLGIASVISCGGIILYGFSVAFSPFYFDIRILVSKTIMSIGSIGGWSSSLIGGLYTISPLLYYVFILHVVTFYIQDFILGWAFWLLSFVLLAESGFFYWINVLLFIIAWGFFIFYYGLIALEKIHAYRSYFSAPVGLSILTDIYVGLLKSCGRFCKGLGVLGQLLLMPITIVWIGWPLVIAYYYMYIYTVIPALVGSGFLAVIGFDALKHLN